MTKDSDFNDDDFLEGELAGLSDDLQTLDESPVSYPPTVEPLHSAPAAQSNGDDERDQDDFFDSFKDGSTSPASDGESSTVAADEDGFLDAFDGYEQESADGHGADPFSEESEQAATSNTDMALPAQQPEALQSEDVPTLEAHSREPYSEPQVISFEDDDPAEATAVDARDSDEHHGSELDDLEEDAGRSVKGGGLSTTKIALIAAPVILLVVAFGVFIKYQQVMGKQVAQKQSPAAEFVPSEVAQASRQPAVEPGVAVGAPKALEQEQSHTAKEPPGSTALGAPAEVSDLFAPVAPVDEAQPPQPPAQSARVDVSDQTPQEPSQQGAFSSSFYDRLGDPRVQFNAAKVTVEPGGQDVTVKRAVVSEGNIPDRPATAVETVDQGLGGAREWLREQFSAVREDMVAINSKLDRASAEREELRDGLDGLARRVTALENPETERRQVASASVREANDDAGRMRIIGLIHGKAWVVIGDEVVTRTIQPGDVVPGFGEVKEIRDDACGVSFVGGQRVCIE